VNKEHNNTLLVGSVFVCMALTPANYSSHHTAHNAVQCTIAAVSWCTMQSNALQQQSHWTQCSPMHYSSSLTVHNAIKHISVYSSTNNVLHVFIL